MIRKIIKGDIVWLYICLYFLYRNFVLKLVTFHIIWERTGAASTRRDQRNRVWMPLRGFRIGFRLGSSIKFKLTRLFFFTWRKLKVVHRRRVCYVFSDSTRRMGCGEYILFYFLKIIINKTSIKYKNKPLTFSSELLSTFYSSVWVGVKLANFGKALSFPLSVSQIGYELWWICVYVRICVCDCVNECF